MQMVEITVVSAKSSEKHVEVNKRESSLSVESTRPLVPSEVDSSASDPKVKHRGVYATVDTVFSGAKSPLTLQSAVQYQEIDIRATRVSR